MYQPDLAYARPHGRLEKFHMYYFVFSLTMKNPSCPHSKAIFFS
uniref:Uncharacterized protein n=1 Tax=Setaria italica TaxID=4555 RepID=K3ZPL7_SETIT